MADTFQSIQGGPADGPEQGIGTIVSAARISFIDHWQLPHLIVRPGTEESKCRRSHPLIMRSTRYMDLEPWTRNRPNTAGKEGQKSLAVGTQSWHGGHMWIDASGSTVLPSPECMRLLAVTAKEGGIGRIGITTDQAPVIVPVNFTLRDGHVVVRVGAGFLARTAGGHLAAFEVDHIDSDAGMAWSVLIRGLATLVEAPSESELEVAGHPLVPEPGDMVLILRPDVITGRHFALHHAA